ncbi:glycoside hydrolase family 10 protein [Maribacter chungangensis]|uniref:Glycoside hydrolase family 10 protein n=1 Tax=Maribacter chungangensis TaxID=1069117 RepID=A0ABW3B5F0_9FLAO
MRHFLLLLLPVLLFNSCGILQSNIPQPKREFRGVWVATVVNIDWPKNGMDTAEKQKKDFLDILNFYDDLNYNAIIVQVRAAGDAFYKSDFAPWSRFLTGEEGKPSDWEEDNLAWMIQETHNRGMEFHAWLNPYRATFDMNIDILSSTHDYCTNPEWMIQYGKKYYYNPGLPEVRNRFSNVIAELVTNYDIDAVHFDDYFYPYKIKDLEFADTAAYETYAQTGQSLDDWRRSNIDSLVQDVNRTIKSIKPWVQFGISPFGVWKNNTTDPRGSDTQAGQTTYEDLYADPLLWMQEGWIDYLAPQVYWSMDLPVASHKKIVDWWANNSNNTNLYIGNGAYKVRNNSDTAWDRKKELPDQMKLARKTPEISGNILFSAKSLMNNNPDVVAHLKKKYYRLPALTPEVQRKEIVAEKKIELLSSTKTTNGLQLSFSGIDESSYILVYKSGKKVKTAYPMKKLVEKVKIENSSGQIVVPTNLASNRYLAITFLDNYGKESSAIVIQPTKTD